MKTIQFDYLNTKNNFHKIALEIYDNSAVYSINYYISYDKIICIYDGKNDQFIVNDDFYNYSTTTARHFWSIFSCSDSEKKKIKKAFANRNGYMIKNLTEYKYNFYFIPNNEIIKCKI